MLLRLVQGRPSSISRALLVRMVALVAITCAAFTVALYFVVIMPVLHELGASEIQRTTNLLQGRVNDMVAQIETVLRTGREMGLRGQFSPHDVQSFNRIFIPVLKQSPLLASAILADDAGHGLFLLRMPNGQWRTRTTDREKWGKRQHWITWSDEGDALGEQWRESDYDPMRRPWYIGAMGLPRESEIYWTEPYIFYTTRDPGMTAAMRWRDSASGHSYVLAFDIGVLDLSRFTSGLRFAVNGISALLTEDGRVLATPRAVTTASDDGIRAAVLKTPAEAQLPLLATALREWTGSGRRFDKTLSFVSADSRWIARFYPVPFGNRSFVAATLAPQADFVPAAMHQLVTTFFSIFIATMAFGGLLAAGIARRLSAPVQALAHESARLGSMDLERPIRVESNLREISALIKAQEGMRRALLASTMELSRANEELESRVQQRTRELAEREAYFRTIFENTGVGIVCRDRSRNVVAVNDAYLRFIGYSREEFLRELPSSYVTAEDQERVGTLLSDLDEGKVGTYRNERRYLTKDGSVRWGDVVTSAIRDADGRLTATITIVTDVTARKETEALLGEARQKAEEATRAKSMFLANMSHEIRTPMNAVIGLSHLALRTDLGPKQRDYVQKIHNAGTSLLGIINDILDFSKIEAGKIEMEHKDFNYDDVLNGLIGVLGQRIEEQKIELLFDTKPDVPQELSGDRLRFGQVLLNLVSNAVKFTEQGHVEVVTRLLERTGNRAKLQIEVRDSGIGMTPDQCARLFQPFTQADGTTTRRYGGTGLGLTISKRLVELMGGAIWVDSKLGHGSTFGCTVWFDVAKARAQSKPETLPAEIRDLSALVVDDNEAARQIMADQLRTFGLRVDTCASGSEAVSLVRERDSHAPIKLVFLDWRMPGLDGIETADAIMSDATLHHMPKLVMVTGFGRDEVRMQAEAAGLHAFLVKPVTASTVFDTLVNLFVAKKEASSESPPPSSTDWSLPGTRILLAEDNEINQQIAVELLEAAGSEVTVANNGLEVLDKLAAGGAEAFDAILMDLQMPDMDGYTAVERIRADKRFRALPVIAMTAHALAEERERCLVSGMSDHIAKPIDPDAMFQTLLRWISPKGQPQTAETQHSANDSDTKIPELPGIDVHRALRRVGGNKSLYRELLGKYASGQATSAQAIRSALAKGDRTLAERLAHTIRGVSGNIGASAVHESAAALEEAIRENRESVAMLAALERLIGTTIDGIVRGLPAANFAPAPPARIARSVTDLHTALAKLSGLLREGSAEAIDYLAQHAEDVRSGIGEAGFESIRQALEEFDFERAQEKLRAASVARA